LKFIKKFAPKLNLPSSTSAAIKQFEKTQNNQLKFKKKNLLIKGRSFDFHYQDISSAIEELLEQQDILDECRWIYEDNCIDDKVI
jgi:tRNA A37 threonylcarbamoyltransferase TsaD